MRVLEKSNFDQTDLAFIDLVALDALLHPNIEKKRRSADLLKGMHIAYDQFAERYQVVQNPTHPRYSARYSIRRIGLHECHVVLDLRGDRIPDAILDLCVLPERYIGPVDPFKVETVLV